jgi:putative salt-induced outer membrane protein
MMLPVITATILAAAAPAEALPEAVRELIEAALADGSAEDVETIARYAKAAYPGAEDEIAALLDAHRERAFSPSSADEVATKDNPGPAPGSNPTAVAQALSLAAPAAGAAVAVVRPEKNADETPPSAPPASWSGEGEIGANRTTGNASTLGFTAGLELARESVDWTHTVLGQIEYLREDGRTVREQYLASYEPRLDLDGRGFIFALAQYEKDRFQGFTDRYSVTGGVGYRLIDRDNLELFVQTGPAWRRSKLVIGRADERIAVRHSLDFDWTMSDRIRLTQTASAFLQQENSTFVSATAITAGLGDDLSARLAYRVEHDTDPPLGSERTDTVSRFTLVYGF